MLLMTTLLMMYHVERGESRELWRTVCACRMRNVHTRHLHTWYLTDYSTAVVVTLCTDISPFGIQLCRYLSFQDNFPYSSPRLCPKTTLFARPLDSCLYIKIPTAWPTKVKPLFTATVIMHLFYDPTRGARLSIQQAFSFLTFNHKWRYWTLDVGQELSQ